jgi:hypothetical protein
MFEITTREVFTSLGLLLAKLPILVFDHFHDLVELLLGFLICDLMDKCTGRDVDTGTLSGKNTLYFLKHLEDLSWTHTAVIIVIT